MRTLRHDFFQEGAKPLPWPLIGPYQRRPPSLHTWIWHRPRSGQCPPTPTQVSIRSRQQKPNWPRKVNAHSTSLHSFPNRIQCKKTAKAASRDCVYWPLWQRSRRPTCTGARHAHCPGPGPRPWSEGDVPLIQLVRRVILCFQYETFHTVKSNPKTSWIQSSHTFKRNFNWCWIEFRLRQDVTSKLCGRHRRFQLWKKERDVRLNFLPGWRIKTTLNTPRTLQPPAPVQRVPLSILEENKLTCSSPSSLRQHHIHIPLARPTPDLRARHRAQTIQWTGCLHPPFLEIIFELLKSRSETFLKNTSLLLRDGLVFLGRWREAAVQAVIKEQMNFSVRTNVWKQYTEQGGDVLWCLTPETPPPSQDAATHSLYELPLL